MPTSPSANPDEKQILTDLVNLSSNSAVASGNQMAVVSDQLARFQHAEDIFNKRYDYWNTYIEAYHLERKLLNGVFIVNPVTSTDYQDFLASKGRLYHAQILNPIRIKEFDNVTGATDATEQNNELNFIAKEAQYRAALQTGFVGTAPLPFGSFFTVNNFSSGDLQVTIELSGFIQTTISAPGQLLITNSLGTQTGVIVEYLTVTEEEPFPGLYQYRLNGLKYPPGFTTIAAASDVASSGPVFTNGERTTKIALNPSLQSTLYAYIQAYEFKLSSWSQNLNQQLAAFAAQIAAGEDAPDTAYQTSLQSSATTLQNLITAQDVSDSGLSSVSGLITLRSGQNPVRIQAIDARLIQQVKAYDQRYQYADKLFNLGDGAVPLITKFQAQKAGLATQQAASNARAASLSGEVF